MKKKKKKKNLRANDFFFFQGSPGILANENLPFSFSIFSFSTLFPSFLFSNPFPLFNSSPTSTLDVENLLETNGKQEGRPTEGIIEER